jgi:DNA replication protein DnaC
MKRDDDDTLDLLLQKLRWLRLPGMAQLLPQLLEKAGKDNLTTLDVIHRLCDEERASRMKSAVERRIKDAKFPELNTIDAFDFDFDTVRKKLRARYLALHDLSFLATGINPLFIGIPGAGKTFLARALAYRACQAARRVVVTSATRMLNELSGAELHSQLERALRRYCRAEFLVIDSC